MLLFVTESPFLARLHENFLDLVKRHPIRLLSYGETVPMQLTWMFQTVLVTNDSAGEWPSLTGVRYYRPLASGFFLGNRKRKLHFAVTRLQISKFCSNFEF